MSRASPEMRKFANRLIGYETRRNKSFATNGGSGFDVCAKLRPQLVTMLGHGGYNGLLARALSLAKAEVPSLRAVVVTANGVLEGGTELHAKLAPGEILEGREVLLAQLLGLLVAFIGEKLTMRLVLEVWPKVILDDLDFGNGGRDEFVGRNGYVGKIENGGKNEKTN
ncbi:MAG: hypothetical protein H7X97_03420 [Opitutaceae bacterium]|nr:hypothetical protein [Verrucomicrobiales bacterium]